MQTTTKIDILTLIEKLTKSFDEAAIRMCTAHHVNDALNISRNLASQYMNALYKDGYFIKINTRPVYFLHKETVETFCNTKAMPDSFLSLEEFLSFVNNRRRNKSNFNKAVGRHESLSHCIEQCITAISYSGYGLPALLLGSSGVGKTYLAKLTCEYAVDNRIVSSMEDCTYVDCGEYIGGGDLFIKKLEKYKQEMTRAPKILVLDNLHVLPTGSLEKFVLFLDFCLSESNGERPVLWRMLFTASNSLDGGIKRKLSSRIPLTIDIPPLEERSLMEKEAFLSYFYMKESKKINRSLAISSTLLSALLNHEYEDNISGLRNTVLYSVANALVNNKAGHPGDRLSILLYNLPDQIFSEHQAERHPSQEQQMIPVNEIGRSANANRVIEFYASILKDNQQDINSDQLERLLSKRYSCINQYYDYLVFEKQYVSAKIQVIERTVGGIIDSISEKYTLNFPSSCTITLSRCIYTRMQFSSLLDQWERSNEKLIDDYYWWIGKHLSNETGICEEIAIQVSRQLDAALGKMENLIIILMINFHNHNIHNMSTLGIIIAHGFSTASSIAHVANSSIGQFVFESIDMPVDVQAPEIAQKVITMLKSKRYVRNLMLLVDMGSLEDLGSYLSDVSSINIGIINNVSTGLAIDVGQSILSENGIQTILQNTCERNRNRYRIIENTQKEKAILFTSENSSSVNQKLVELFMFSLPKKTRIHIMPYDYKSLCRNKKTDPVFTDYDVLFICGTLDPTIKDIRFISLENIVSTEEINLIATSLYPYLSDEELNQLKENLLVRFSLENIVEYLTILDVKKVIGFVNDAVNLMQSTMNIRIDFTTSFGLFIHISCMIERMVTKQADEEDLDWTSLTKTELYYMDVIAGCFKQIAAQYKITIPQYEIYYIYNYIKSYLKQ